ncbi:MAG: hypothetical protein HY683_09745 [Chloroflexi bacterium]|nr:hypothetical protein [Chloroflexota bacterium]
MSFIMRRVMYGKPGTADQIVQVLKDSEQLVRRYDARTKMRILVDHMSGRSDRVVGEFEMNDVADFYAFMGQVMSKPEVAAEYKALEERGFQLVDYSEAEWWRVV